MNNVLFSISRWMRKFVVGTKLGNFVDNTRFTDHGRQMCIASPAFPLHCLNFRIFSLSTQWFGSKCGGWVNQANLCCIYAFTITIMFIVVCRAQHVASVARELQCWRNCFNVFSMQSALRNAAAVVSLLSFSLEHGSFGFLVVNGTLKL